MGLPQHEMEAIVCAPQTLAMSQVQGISGNGGPSRTVVRVSGACLLCLVGLASSDTDFLFVFQVTNLQLGGGLGGGLGSGGGGGASGGGLGGITGFGVSGLVLQNGTQQRVVGLRASSMLPPVF